MSCPGNTALPGKAVIPRTHTSATAEAGNLHRSVQLLGNAAQSVDASLLAATAAAWQANDPRADDAPDSCVDNEAADLHSTSVTSDRHQLSPNDVINTATHDGIFMRDTGRGTCSSQPGQEATRSTQLSALSTQLSATISTSSS